MKLNKTVIAGAAGIIAAGIGTFLYMRKRARKNNPEPQKSHSATERIHSVMHKAKAAHA